MHFIWSNQCVITWLHEATNGCTLKWVACSGELSAWAMSTQRISHSLYVLVTRYDQLCLPWYFFQAFPFIFKHRSFSGQLIKNAHGARINTINFHSLLYQPVSPKRNITSEQTRLPRSCLTSWNAWLLFHRVKKVLLKNTRKCNTVREEQGRLSATHRGMLTTHLCPVNSSVEWNNTELSWWSADSCSEAA